MMAQGKLAEDGVRRSNGGGGGAAAGSVVPESSSSTMSTTTTTANEPQMHAPQHVTTMRRVVDNDECGGGNDDADIIHPIASPPPPVENDKVVVVVEDHQHHLNKKVLAKETGSHSAASSFSSLEDSNSVYFSHLAGASAEEAHHHAAMTMSGRHSDFTVPTSNACRGSPPLELPSDDEGEGQQQNNHELHDDEYYYEHQGGDDEPRRSIFGTYVEQRYHHHTTNTAPQPLRLQTECSDVFVVGNNGCEDGYAHNYNTSAAAPQPPSPPPPPTCLIVQPAPSVPQQQNEPSSPLFYLPKIHPSLEDQVRSQLQQKVQSSSSSLSSSNNRNSFLFSADDNEHSVFSRRTANTKRLPVIVSQHEMEVEEANAIAAHKKKRNNATAKIIINKQYDSSSGTTPSSSSLSMPPLPPLLIGRETSSASDSSEKDDKNLFSTPPRRHEKSDSLLSTSSSASSSHHRSSRRRSLHKKHHHYHHQHHHHSHVNNNKRPQRAHETIHAQSLLLGLAFAAVWSPYNLMAPNLTEMADTFSFNAQQRDLYLGSYAALATGVFSFPIGAGIGILTDFYSRKYLFVATVLLGALSALCTGLSSQRYSMLLLSRLLSGGFMAGSVPVAFSFLGDLFSVQERNAASSGLTAMMGLGIIAGQVYAGFVGPTSPSGWQHAFYVSAAVSFVLAMCCMLWVQEPERGGKEKVLQDLIKAGTRYDRKLSWSVFYNVVRNNKSTLILLWQGFFSSIPWGIIFTFLNDVLSQEQGLSVQAATYLVFWYGVGCAAGGIAGGYWGQKLQDVNRTFLPLFMGITTALGIVPFWWLLTRPLTPNPLPSLTDAAATTGGVGAAGVGVENDSATPTTTMAVALAVLCGFTASLPSVNVRPILINVNPPETRGASLTAANILINLGRGFGPSCVTFFTWISTTYLNKNKLSSLLYHGHFVNDDDDSTANARAAVDQHAFGSPRLHAILAALCIFWIVSAILLFLLMRTVPIDQDAMEADLADYAEQAMMSLHGNKTASTSTMEDEAGALLLTDADAAAVPMNADDDGVHVRTPIRAKTIHDPFLDEEGGVLSPLSMNPPVLSSTADSSSGLMTQAKPPAEVNPIMSLLQQTGIHRDESGGTSTSLLSRLSSASHRNLASSSTSAAAADLEEFSIEDRVTSFDSVAARQTLVWGWDGIKELREEVMLKKNQKINRMCQPCREISSEEEDSSCSDGHHHDDDSSSDDPDNNNSATASPQRTASDGQETTSGLAAAATTTTTTTKTADDDKERPTEKTPLLV